ncbi:hypothetical protein MOBT1_002320 [Malassezia obtusa]|uniref:BZIP domain-containing protein n=1 Tax=Malassezia obtusa TaxID=76774 RepID=A0AAF0E4Z4_9BASI|nr:hypothetical protein MOBT1_002320 [Malassezia obtusa]
MLRNAPTRSRQPPSSPPALAGEDEEALLRDFWKNFDQTKFLRQLDSYTPHAQATKAPDVAGLVLPPLEPLVSTSLPVQQPSNPEIPVEFYGQLIQILTFVLGSNPPMLADSATTPRAENWEPQQPGSKELTPEDWKTLHNVVMLIMDHFGSSAPAPSTLVSTQELTRLLQKLMAIQQENERRASFQAFPSPLPYTPGDESMQQFLHTEFAEDEDEDDPDFQPPPVDDHALSPAWRRALHDLTANPLPPLEAPASPAKATRARKRAEAERPPAADALPAAATPQAPLDDTPELAPLRPALPEAPRRGRRAIYTAEEARERKRERNRQHMRMKRSGERLAPARSVSPDDALVREAEIKFLREEVARLREENARLRGREEMRQYAAQMGLSHPLPPCKILRGRYT